MRTVALLVLLPLEALADDFRPEWNVLYGHEEFRKAETMLHDHLAKVRAAADQDREKVIGNVRTPAELQKYQAQTAARLQAVLGEFPPRTALNAKTVGRLDRPGYAVEKVIFESRPRRSARRPDLRPDRGAQ